MSLIPATSIISTIVLGISIYLWHNNPNWFSGWSLPRKCNLHDAELVCSNTIFNEIISEINTNTFQSLRLNNIEDLKGIESLTAAPSLLALEIVNTQIVSSISFKRFQKLKSLKLLNNWNQLNNDKVFEDLFELSELEIDETFEINFDALPKSIEKLSLHNFKLEIHENLFHHLKNLTEFRLTNCEIGEFNSAAFFDPKTIQLLQLSDCALTSLSSPQFASFGNLEHLILSNNQINSIDYSFFASFTNLVYLDLSGNQIGEINFLQGFTFLKELYLDNNKVSKIDPFEFKQASMLQILSLSNNELFYVDINELSQVLRRLEIFNLDGNPWNCYKLYQMLVRLDETDITIVDFGPSHFDVPNERGVPCIKKDPKNLL